MTESTGLQIARFVVLGLMLAGIAFAALYNPVLKPIFLENEVREILQSALKDAESAKLRKLRRTATGDICGEVNAKNSYGAYSGFEPFFINKKTKRISVGEDTYAGLRCR